VVVYELKQDRILSLQKVSFRDAGILERQGLQSLLRERIEVVDPEIMVLAEEFGQWDESRRRIDLLCLDREARIVVVELKRTEGGGHMELQALRYAAMVSRMTFDQAVSAHGKWLETIGNESDAESEILSFLGWDEPDEESFGQDTRIVLVSADFSKELTTSVLWLNERDLDVRCVRLRPYQDGERVLLDVQQVIPLPEAGDYIIQVREKERRERRSREFGRDYTRYDVTVDGKTYERLAKRNAIHLVAKALCAHGIIPSEIAGVIDWRRDLWRSAAGALDADQFAVKMEEAAFNGGKAWAARRWHATESSLIVSEGRTWAITNQWGNRTGEAIDALIARWPQAGVTCKESHLESQ